MSRHNAGPSFASLRVDKLIRDRLVSYAVCASLLGGVACAQNQHSVAEPSPAPNAVATQPSATDAVVKQAEREAAFAKLLSGATLDGNFTMTDSGTSEPGHEATKLTHDKYTLGEVKKLDGNQWLIPARIQYGDHDFTLPLALPIQWAGDTPVIIVENVGLPGMGGMSARVMFFDDHYAGFWQHGTRTGHLFGVIRHPDAKAAPSDNDAH